MNSLGGYSNILDTIFECADLATSPFVNLSFNV
jgi:hypothetical protein